MDLINEKRHECGDGWHCRLGVGEPIRPRTALAMLCMVSRAPNARFLHIFFFKWLLSCESLWRSGRGHLCGGGIQFTTLTVAVLAAGRQHHDDSDVGIKTASQRHCELTALPVILSGKGAKAISSGGPVRFWLWFDQSPCREPPPTPARSASCCPGETRRRRRTRPRPRPS